MKLKNDLISRFQSDLSRYFFPDLPEHYSLRKKVGISLSNTYTGSVWHIIQASLILYACSLQVTKTYENNYDLLNGMYLSEMIITQLFELDFLLHWFISESNISFFMKLTTMIDIFTILPVYIDPIVTLNVYPFVSFLRVLRMLRLIRLFHSFRLIKELNGINKQLTLIAFSMILLTYVAAGILQIVDNSVEINCNYINEYTNWQPSCDPVYPMYNDNNCDCNLYQCRPSFTPTDNKNEPSRILCKSLTYYDAFYLVIVTVATVGYGDITIRTVAGKGIIILLIFVAVLIIPQQLNHLQKLLSLSSPYSRPYNPHNHVQHIIICGHTIDKKKMERFLKEFFHPDRASADEYHAVILSPEEPTEEIRSLIFAQALESKCTYVLGSALSSADLSRASIETAIGIFFLCDADVAENLTNVQDASNVLRVLSVSNYNAEIMCLVQILKSDEKTILHDNEIDVMICLDEFKLAIQARNAMCPGFSTFVENIFHSFGSIDPDISKSLAPWYNEYLSGAGMELYFVPLSKKFLHAMRYSFRRVAEAFYLKFNTIIIGVFNTLQSDLIFNPIKDDFREYENPKNFFLLNNIALVMTDDQLHADEIKSSINENIVIDEILTLIDQHDAKVTFGSNINKSINRKMKKNMNDVIDDDDEYSDFDDSEEEENDRRYSIGYTNFYSSQLNETTFEDSKPKSGFDLISRQSARDSIRKSTRSSSRLSGVQKRTGSTLRNLTEINGEISREELINAVRKKMRKKIDQKLSRRLTKNVPTKALLSEEYGLQSTEIENCEELRGHIICHGCESNLSIFIEELRRPSVHLDSYHPVVIVDQSIPSEWESIKVKYNDCYLIKGDITDFDFFQKLNIDYAYTLILLGSRSEMLSVDGQKINSVALFNYLKLEPWVPSSVFFTIELNNAANIAVLNATILRRIRMSLIEQQEKMIALMAPDQLNAYTTTLGKGGSLFTQSSFMKHLEVLGLSSLSTQSTRIFPSLSSPKNSSSSTSIKDCEVESSTNNANKKNADNEGAVRKKLVLFDGDGQFATKRQKNSVLLNNSTNNDSDNRYGSPLQRRLSNINGPLLNFTKVVEEKDSSMDIDNNKVARIRSRILHARDKSSVVEDKSILGLNKKSKARKALRDKIANDLFKDEEIQENLWDALDSHHVLPVFAAGRSFVPSSFETLLVQSFYIRLTPLIYNNFVVGKNQQSTTQIDVPSILVGKPFIDLFINLIHCQILALGIYRAPQKDLGSYLPYMFTSPPHDTVLDVDDRILVYASNKTIDKFKNFSKKKKKESVST